MILRDEDGRVRENLLVVLEEELLQNITKKGFCGYNPKRTDHSDPNCRGVLELQNPNSEDPSNSRLGLV